MIKSDDRGRLLAAAEWMRLLAEGGTLSEAQCEEYAEWIQSPGAEGALSRVEYTYSLSAQLHADPDIAELIAQSKVASVISSNHYRGAACGHFGGREYCHPQYRQ